MARAATEYWWAWHAAGVCLKHNLTSIALTLLASSWDPKLWSVRDPSSTAICDVVGRSSQWSCTRVQSHSTIPSISVDLHWSFLCTMLYNKTGWICSRVSLPQV